MDFTDDGNIYPPLVFRKHFAFCITQWPCQPHSNVVDGFIRARAPRHTRFIFAGSVSRDFTVS